jgi:anti-sigma regulatory factor (Ser/Thr protein kinase)
MLDTASPSRDGTFRVFRFLGQVVMSNWQSACPAVDTGGNPAPVFTPRANRTEDLPPAPRPRLNDSGDNWWYRSYLELAAMRTAPPCARLHARARLAEWGLASLSDDAELIVSELTTNALLASGAIGEYPPVIRLWLLSDTSRLVIVVWDGSLRPPALTEAPAAAEHGRGLQIVAAVSSDWGWYGRSDIGGKCVWAVVRKIPAEFMT